MGIKITDLMGQVTKEEQKKKEREEITKLMQPFSKNADLKEFARNNLKELMFNLAKEEREFLGQITETKDEQKEREFNDRVNDSMKSLMQQQALIESSNKRRNKQEIENHLEALRQFEAERQQTTQQPELMLDAGAVDDKGLSKLEKQQAAILKAIRTKQFKPMAIPDNEKGVIKLICESDEPELFEADTAFDRAWKLGIKKLWQMENHESYARRGNN